MPEGRYNLLFERRSWRDIADQIGGGFTYNGVKNSLKNPCWKGVRLYHAGRETPLEIPLGIEPLIAPARWEAAQRIILEKRVRWIKTRKPPRFLLSGLLTCGCGKPVYIRVSKHSYYYCSTGFPGRGPKCGAPSTRVEAAEKTVEQIVSAHLLDAAFLRTILRTVQNSQPARNQETAKLARERHKLEAERQKLLRLTLKGLCSEDDFARESKRIEAELRSLDGITPASVPDAFDPAKILIRITRTFARFSKQPFEERRGVLQAAFREIAVQDGAIPQATLNGAWLSACVNSSPRLRRRRWLPAQSRASRSPRP
jgi:hypothetical protein